MGILLSKRDEKNLNFARVLMDLVHQTYKLQTTQSHESKDNLGNIEHLHILHGVQEKSWCTAALEWEEQEPS